MPKDSPDSRMTAGGAIFSRLKALGVDYVFCNSGTDFPPIIEGLAEAMAKGIDLPRALVIPHESAALGMAHGYYVATGKAQAVMLHTNVGLANGAMGMINAATDHVPLILMSGRTPTVEQGRFGARTVPIGWGQEMRDQSALVRETSKWDYEMRFPEQVPEMLDRAHAIASSTPSGPVYLSLPREVLCEPCPIDAVEAPITMAASRAAAPEGDLRALAEMLIKAQRPLIIAQRGAGSQEGFDALARLAEDWALPVCQYWAGALAISYEHPSCVGSDVEPWLSEADVVLVVDGLAPWSPEVHAPLASAEVVNLGPDPLHQRFPVRNFRSDLSITGEVGDAFTRLEALMRDALAEHQPRLSARRVLVAEQVDSIREAASRAATGGATVPMTKAYVAKCVGEAVRDHDATVLCELGCPLDHVRPTRHGSWRDLPHSGGLGWSLPTGMGMKLAEPDRLIISTMGDGSYMFANPVACHQIAEAYEIPTLSVILNNQEWFAVRRAALGMYPKGHAAKANQMPLTALSPSPEFARIAEASRGYGQTVTDPTDLPKALARGIEVVMNEKRAAVINVMVA
jgi:acetolactate synthase I/II/III large subunit